MPRSPEMPPNDHLNIPKEGDLEDKSEEPDDDIEWEKTEVIAPVSERYLRALYGSQEFLSHLGETIDQIQQFKGREFGFGIWKQTDTDDTWFSRPIGGELESQTGLEKAEEEMRREFYEIGLPRSQVSFLSSLHFHPDLGEDPLIIPSPGDLISSARSRANNRHDTGWDIPPLELIAARLLTGEVKCVIYQEPFDHSPFLYEAIAQELRETIRDLCTRKDVTQEEVIQTLHHYKYKALTLSTEGSQFSRRDLDRLASLSFTPEKLTEKG